MIPNGRVTTVGDLDLDMVRFFVPSECLPLLTSRLKPTNDVRGNC